MTFNETIINCPKCGAEIRLTEAVSHNIREELSAEFERKRALQEKTLAEREEKLAQARLALDERTRTVQAEVASKVEQEKSALLTLADRKARENSAVELKDLRAQLLEKQLSLEKAQSAELDLRQRQRKIEEAAKNLELELARKLDQERNQIADAARQQGVEQERFRLAEKEKLISDLQKQIDTLKQKAEQGSMQLQGEVMELELEGLLRANFRSDEFTAVATGVRGADLLQEVRAGAGLVCSSILWETKRTKNWGKDWPAKLKEDQRETRAEIAVIVTQTLPQNCRAFGQVDGVWVCDYQSALPLATVLRHGLISTAAARQAECGKQTKMDQLHAYLAGPGFRQQVEALVEVFQNFRNGLDQERRAFTKIWAAREKEIERAIGHTATLYGSVQGILGQATLPEIPVLQLQQL